MLLLVPAFTAGLLAMPSTTTKMATSKTRKELGRHHESIEKKSTELGKKEKIITLYKTYCFFLEKDWSEKGRRTGGLRRPCQQLAAFPSA